MANGSLWKGKPIVGEVTTWNSEPPHEKIEEPELRFSFASCPECRGVLNIGEQRGTRVRILTCELLDLDGFRAAGQYFKHEYLVIREKKQ